MGLPQGVEPGERPGPGESFELYPSYASVLERPYKRSLEYVVRFPQSVRGLRPGAPVEYRGIRFGSVERLLLQEQASEGLTGQGMPIPVLIRVQPGRLELPDSKKGTLLLAETLQAGVGNGLRATLATGSLITGSLYVSLDFYPAARPAEMGSFADRPTIPTIATGLAGMEQKVSHLLDKLNELPLDKTLEGVERTLASLNDILNSPETRGLPGSVEATLDEARGTLASVAAGSPLQTRVQLTLDDLDRTLAALRSVLETLDEQPNALIFNREFEADPEPPAGELP
jgi:paraquat-inducible protein B